MTDATGTTRRERRSLRRQIERALSNAMGPYPLNEMRSPDGKLIPLPRTFYTWLAILPDGEPVVFGSISPTFDRATIIDRLVEHWGDREREWRIAECAAPCPKHGSRCTCEQNTVTEFSQLEEQ